MILKSVSGERLVQALERTVSGERMGMSHVTRSPRSEQTNELSNREKEVLALLALGSTNRQIANELYLSVDTVKSHMRRLYSKLGVSATARRRHFGPSSTSCARRWHASVLSRGSKSARPAAVRTDGGSGTRHVRRRR